MPRGKTVTADTVRDVRSAKVRWPDMTAEEVGRFAGVSEATVHRILRGEYDGIAGSVAADGGVSAEALAAIRADLAEARDDLDDVREAVANIADLAHIACLLLAEGLVAKEGQAQWRAVIEAADPRFSMAPEAPADARQGS